MAGRPDWTSVDLPRARDLLEGALFDAAFYRSQAKLGAQDDAFAHYFQLGLASGLKPNLVFDPVWYVRENPEAEPNPLLHYALVGEAEDRDPSPLFDVAWYRGAYAAEQPLAHYLKHRFGPISPIPEFDAAFYLQTYPDVAAARLDPFLHYMHFGYRDFRKPSAGFNPRLYANRWLRSDRGANPLVHMRAHKHTSAPSAKSAGPFEQVRVHARRGSKYEDALPATAGPKPKVLTLAFHLTQFHRIPENDAWWGEGFTEWTHLARGQSRFEGHYQPRIPGKLGFYDLADPAALRAQAALAKGAGVSGFVFYYYDFDGHRLLERPLEQFLAAPDIDIGFCLMWANENWTRRWDGAEQELLIAQTYDERDEARRCAEFARHFHDPRYIRLGGRPLLMVYRASLIPETARTLERWRRLFALNFSENPILVMAQCFDDVDPRPLGFDAAIEFPPHKLTKGLPQIYNELNIYDEAFEADAFAYSDLVEASLAESAPVFPLIRTAVPSWDNDARRQGQGLTLVGSSPLQYQRWLAELVARAEARPFFGSPIVGVNAWNEWSEGAYLEPDVHFGSAYLNATTRAIRGLRAEKAAMALAGADARLADLARRMAAAFGFAVVAVNATSQASGAAFALTSDVAAAVALADVGLRVGLRASAAALAPDAMSRASVLITPDASVAAEHANALAEPPESADGEQSDRFLRTLFAALAPDIAKISVVLLGLGDAVSVKARLESLFNQTHPVWEILAFDRGADDATLDAVEQEARLAERDLALVLSDGPDERDVDLWRRGVGMASGDFVWAVEAGGLSDAEVLASLAASLQSDPRLVFACCASRRVDGQGRPVGERRAPFEDSRRAYFDASFDGAAFVDRFLAEGDAFATPGAVLWRRDALAQALPFFQAQQPFDFAKLCRLAADLPGARVRYVAEPLNFIRSGA